MISKLESILFENRKIISISKFASKANFKLYTANKELDIVNYISEYVKNIPPHAQAAQKMSMKYPDKTPKRGQWIEYVITLDGPIMATQKPLKYNLQHYLEKQLAPIADSILPVLNMSFDQFLSGQANLFEN